MDVCARVRMNFISAFACLLRKMSFIFSATFTYKLCPDHNLIHQNYVYCRYIVLLCRNCAWHGMCLWRCWHRDSFHSFFISSEFLYEWHGFQITKKASSICQHCKVFHACNFFLFFLFFPFSSLSKTFR